MLEQIPEHAVSVLAVVPVLLQRLLDAPEFDGSDLSTLRVVASNGSALPVPTVLDWLNRGGPNLYNLYGSTEVGQATLATPADLSVHPDTAGRKLDGSEIGIFDDDGSLLPAGSVGRIFVGGSAQFDGYTGGGGQEVIEGLMSTGDVGQRLAAFVVMAPGAKITKPEARALVADQLARHKVPRDVTFRDGLPRTATGWIQRDRL